MTTVVTELLILAAMILSIFIPIRVFFIGERNKKRYKKSLGFNTVLFFGLLVMGVVCIFAAPTATAEALEGDVAAASGTIAQGLGYIGAALATSISGIGGGIAVASAASAALGAVSEDSSLLGKSLIFVGLAEGVCLYGFIISIMILGKL